MRPRKGRNPARGRGRNNSPKQPKHNQPTNHDYTYYICRKQTQRRTRGLLHFGLWTYQGQSIRGRVRTQAVEPVQQTLSGQRVRARSNR